MAFRAQYGPAAQLMDVAWFKSGARGASEVQTLCCGIGEPATRGPPTHPDPPCTVQTLPEMGLSETIPELRCGILSSTFLKNRKLEFFTPV